MVKRIRIFVKYGRKILTKYINRSTLKDYSKIGYHNGRRLWKNHARSRRTKKFTSKTSEGRKYAIYRFPLYAKYVSEDNINEFLGYCKQKYNIVRNRDKKFVAQRLILILSYDKDYKKRRVKSKISRREYLKVYGSTDEIGTSYFERDNLSTAEMFRQLGQIIDEVLQGNLSYAVNENEGFFHAVDMYVQFIENRTGDSNV